MENNVTMNRVKIVDHSGKGGVWLIGWLFTIGFAGLTFGQGILAIVIWPYYLGLAIKAIVH